MNSDQILDQQRQWKPSGKILSLYRENCATMAKVTYLDGSSEWCTPLQVDSWAATQ